KLRWTERRGNTSSLRFSSLRIHCEPMRQTLQWTWVVALTVLLGTRLARAESPTNSPVASASLQESDVCVHRLREIYDEASRLEEKTPPEQMALVDCVRSRVLKIKGLLELTEEAQKGIQKALRAAE